MPQASDDQIRVTLPRYAVKALELHAKTQAKALLVLADSPVKGMKRKSEARRAEAEAWKLVSLLCGEAMAESDHRRMGAGSVNVVGARAIIPIAGAFDVPPVAIGEDGPDDLVG